MTKAEDKDAISDFELKPSNEESKDDLEILNYYEMGEDIVIEKKQIRDMHVISPSSSSSTPSPKNQPPSKTTVQHFICPYCKMDL